MNEMNGEITLKQFVLSISCSFIVNKLKWNDKIVLIEFKCESSHGQVTQVTTKRTTANTTNVFI